MGNWVLFRWVGQCSVNLRSNFLLMGRAVFPPCLLACGPSMVGVMATSSKRTSAIMLRLLGLLSLVPLTPWQATVDPRLLWRLLDTHRQVWLSNPSLTVRYFSLSTFCHDKLFCDKNSWKLKFYTHPLVFL